jgi:hypothetical protein
VHCHHRLFAIAFRPCETAVSIRWRCGSQALAEGFARSVTGKIGSVITSMAAFESEFESVITFTVLMAAFA